MELAAANKSGADTYSNNALAKERLKDPSSI
jgi:hypothetical protein